jgi:hypothetical protein
MNIFTFLLVFYFVSGLCVSVAIVVMNIINHTKLTVASFCVLLAALPLWPFYARLVVGWIRNPNLSHCAWCGVETDKRDTEAIQAHIMGCEKHPMRGEIEVLKTENAMLLNALLEANDVVDKAD